MIRKGNQLLKPVLIPNKPILGHHLLADTRKHDYVPLSQLLGDGRHCHFS